MLVAAGSRASRKGFSSEIDVAENLVRTHSSEAYFGSNQIKPCLVCHRASGDDSTILNHCGWEAGDAGRGPWGKTDIAVADECSHNTCAGDRCATKHGEFSGGKQDRGRT